MTDPLILVLCHDTPDGKEARALHLEAHRTYLKAEGSPLRLAGPMGAGDRPGGTFLVLAVDDPAEARRFVEGDPFYAAGVFEEISIQPLKITIDRL